MKTKGDMTRQFILTEAKKLFVKKGYSSVTMKDICEVCSLSRGGLYRYFGSVEDIFIAMLSGEKEVSGKFLAKSIKSKAPAKELLAAFLMDRKETIGSECGPGLSFAIQEFAHMGTDHQCYMARRYKDTREVLSLLLRYGQEEDTFKDFDVNDMAMHILFLLDSLENNSVILHLSEEEIDRHFTLLFRLVLKE